MPDIPRLGDVVIARRLHADRSVVVASGNFSDLLQSYREHVRIWGPEPDGLTDTMARQGLAATALHLTGRPRDESVGITMNIRTPPINVFLAGAADGSVIGRVFTENVKTADASRFFLQSVRPGTQPTLSAIEVRGLDVLGIFEQYYEQSLQYPARFYELGDDRFLMVQGLPGVDREWVRALDCEQAWGLTNGDGLALDERRFRFHCGCNPQKILEALRGIFASNPDDLFRGEEQVETFCPRCGRRWWIRRESF